MYLVLALCLLLLISVGAKNLIDLGTDPLEEESFDLLSMPDRAYTVVDDKWSWDKMFAAWKKDGKKFEIKKSKTRSLEAPTLEEIQTFIETYQEAFNTTIKYMQDYVNGKGIVITSRLKSAESILGKVAIKQKKYKNTNPDYGLEDIQDIIGIRLVTQTVDIAVQVSKDFNVGMHGDKYNVTQTPTCYGMCPGAGKYRPSGHRGIHIDLTIFPQRKFAELQVSTPFSLKWDTWNHDLVYKGASKTKNDPGVKAYTLAMAEYLWKLDEDKRVLPSCPSLLANTPAIELLSHLGMEAPKVFKKMGSPPSGCFWWNDNQQYAE